MRPERSKKELWKSGSRRQQSGNRALGGMCHERGVQEPMVRVKSPVDICQDIKEERRR